MVHRILQYVSQTIDRMDMRDWVVVLFAMIFVGFMCLRGFGSRKDY